jgi:hypothetical protein
MKGRFTAATLALLFLACASVAARSPQPAASASQPPEASVRAFYAWHLPRSTRGLPERPELEQLRTFISRRLYSLFNDALKYREDLAAFIKRTGGDGSGKAPCGEGGDYFDGLHEWPDNVRSNAAGDPVEQFEILRTKQSGRNRWYVRIHFWYDTTPRVTWEDTVVAVAEDGRFVIDDVVYVEGGPFHRSSALSAHLKSCAHGQGY